ncbi:MAG: rhomboid family intramembrane serine protease [Polyangiaceae bacterium]|nr:rhomboid family intramembrane serine protease [Polyangiaceae bacterium]
MKPAGRFSLAVERPTSVLLGANVLVYLAMLAVGGRAEWSAFSTRTLMRFGADYAPLVLEGQAQRLVTSMFLHLNPLHLLMNMAALVTIGPALEERYGRLRFVILYFASGVVGSLASVAWHHLNAPAVSAGASGALCGIIAAGAVAAHFAGAEGRSTRNSLVGWLLATLAFGVLIHADNAAHLGGMAAGALGGMLWAKRPAGSTRSTLPSYLSVAVMVAAFGVTIAKRHDSETAGQLVNRGVELSRGDDEEGAARLYRRAVELEPKDPIAHYDLGLALENLQDYDGAIAELGRAFELEPSDDRKRALALCHYNKGVMLAGKKDTAGAIDEYRRALELLPDDALIRSTLGLSLLAGGDGVAGATELGRAHELEPKNTDIAKAYAQALVLRGNLLLHDDKPKEAIAQYKKAIAVDERSFGAHLNLGRALLKTKDFDAAVKSLERAHELAPSDVTKDALAAGLEARSAVRDQAGDTLNALDDVGRATTLRLAPK